MAEKTLAVIGGKLQGTEAAYLAAKAGFRVLLIDKDPCCPAFGLCDVFMPLNVTQEEQLQMLKGKADLVLPVLENEQALEALSRLGPQLGIPLAFDFEAYSISSSKMASNALFAELDLPCPAAWPACGFPVLAKPVSASGSENVQIFTSQQEFKRFFKEDPIQDWILQEYLPGPSYSLEILGCKGKFVSLSVTDLYMDEQHDCCRVTAPSTLSSELAAEFTAISERIATALPLTGIMDVEVIAAPSGLKLLEIDARLPSQTPTAVYWSTGVNIVELLAEIHLTGSLVRPQPTRNQAVVYEHVLVNPAGISRKGEHLMSLAGPLRLVQDFFGADEAITDFAQGKKSWAATLIISAPNLEAAWAKRDKVLDTIAREMNIEY